MRTPPDIIGLIRARNYGRALIEIARGVVTGVVGVWLAVAVFVGLITLIVKVL